MYDSFNAALEGAAKGTQGLSRLRGNSHGLVLRGGGGSNAASLPDFIDGMLPVVLSQIAANYAGEVHFYRWGVLCSTSP